VNQAIHKLRGANMDIDLATPAGQIPWQQDACPWNAADNTDQHRCAVKNISICPLFSRCGNPGYAVVRPSGGRNIK
jgi:hypothetical protein